MSARNVYAAMNDSKYDVTLCLIDKKGRWWLQKTVDDFHAGQPQLLPIFGQQQFITLPEHHVVKPDVVVPVLHGKNGEDGTIQGVCEMLGIPYVGPSLLGAAVTMEKDMTKRLLREAGVPVVPWKVWHTSDEKPTYDELKEELGEVLFVKPSQAGSSVGVTKVRSADELDGALNLAAEHDNIVLIEKSIDARELELAVLGNNHPEVQGPGEIHLGEEFYSYDDKYANDSKSSVSIPAEVAEDVAIKLREYTLTAYRATGGRGLARIDFFLDKETGEVYLNEINSLPGFTNISMYPKLWQHGGLKYPQLVDKLIQLALE